MKIKYTTYFFILLVFLSFNSCTEKKEKKAIRIVKEWTGKEIQFPKNLECITFDSILQCPETYHTNYEILLYVDSLGCTSCRTKLFKCFVLFFICKSGLINYYNSKLYLKKINKAFE
jgi:hypothetical protein